VLVHESNPYQQKLHQQIKGEYQLSGICELVCMD
jgi:hypothetical protein